jgi:hypothetical protein
VRAAIQPESTGLELARGSRGVTTPVPCVYLPVSLTAPGPSGSTGPTRLCRGCSHPHRRPPAQTSSSFTPPLRRQRNGGLAPPSETSAPRGALRLPPASPHRCDGEETKVFHLRSEQPRLVAHHQELGIPGRLTPGQHHHAAEQAAREQVHDREDHSAMIPAHKTGQARSSNRALQGDAGQPQAPQRVAVARQLGALQDTGPQVQHPAVAGWSRLASQTGPDRA